jgi:hypothetical protein
VKDLAVERVGRVEIRTEPAVDQNFNEAGPAEKPAEFEALDTERKNVLGANALKPFGRAIPVLVFVLQSAQLVVVFEADRQLSPDAVDDGQTLRPAHMAVAADDVLGDEVAVGGERGVDRVKQMLEITMWCSEWCAITAP